MATLQDWIDRRCACVHPNARECLEVRYRRSKLRLDPQEACECVCHDLPEPDEIRPPDVEYRER